MPMPGHESRGRDANANVAPCGVSGASPPRLWLGRGRRISNLKIIEGYYVLPIYADWRRLIPRENAPLGGEA